MASLFKQTYWTTDPATGKRTRHKTKTWYGKYGNADGLRCRVPLSTNKTAAEQMLAELLTGDRVSIEQLQRKGRGRDSPIRGVLLKRLSESLARKGTPEPFLT